MHFAVHNPECYKDERLRLSNYATPRSIRCHAEDLEHLVLPRGSSKLLPTGRRAGSWLGIDDPRSEPKRVQLPAAGLSRGEALALLCEAIVEDAERTAHTCEDVARAMRASRTCLLLSGPTGHGAVLLDGLRHAGCTRSSFTAEWT